MSCALVRDTWAGYEASEGWSYRLVALSSDFRRVVPVMIGMLYALVSTARYQTTYLGRDLTSLHSALGGLIHTYDSSSRSSSPFSPSKPDSHSAAASNSSLIALKSEKGDNEVHDDGAMNEVLERLEWALRGEL